MKKALLTGIALLLCATLAGCFQIDLPAKSAAPSPAAASASPAPSVPGGSISPAPEPTAAPTPTPFAALSDEEKAIAEKLGNEKIQDFMISGFYGELFDTSLLRGKILVIYFWSTQSEPCEAELPELQKNYTQFGEDVRFIAIDTQENISKHDLITFLDTNGFTFTVTQDMSKLSLEMGVKTLPTTLIIDPLGRLSIRHTGAFSDGTELMKLIDNVRKYYSYKE
jgi:thiol-disulfide isomerase/thioredoxin